MSYIEAVTEPLIKTLSHTAGLPAQQLAGHAANLEFWVNETVHAYEVIDGYSARFKRLQEGEQSYAEFSGKMWHYPPTPPVRPGISDSELKDLRRRLAESIYLVLRRCYKEDLIEEPDLERFGASLSLDIVDIKRLDK